MGSKMLVLLGLSFAFALLISSSEVRARDLAKTTPTIEGAIRGISSKKPPHVEVPSGCLLCPGGRCCPPAEEAALEATQVKPQN